MTDPNDLNDEIVDDEIVDDEIVDDKEIDEPSELSEDDVQKLLSVPDETLKKYGVDDPKQWKSYQRALTKAKNEWKQKEAEYESKLQPKPESDKIAQLEQQIQELRTPKPVEEKLIPPEPPKQPKRPSNFDWSQVGINGTPEQQYMDAKDEYDFQYREYNNDMATYNLKIVERQAKAFEAERQKMADQSQRERAKAETIGKLQIDGGLTPEEAADCFDMAMKDPNFFDPKSVGLVYKVKKTGKLPESKKTDKFNNLKNKRNKGFLPGMGGNPGSADNPNEFLKSTDTTHLYKTTK